MPRRISPDRKAHRWSEGRDMRKSSFSPVQPYIVALALVVATTLLTHRLRPWIEEAARVGITLVGRASVHFWLGCQ
jgi:hypothetical protein